MKSAPVDDGTFFALNPHLADTAPPARKKKPSLPVCQRCHSLTHNNKTPADIQVPIRFKPLAKVLSHSALLVCIVDVFDYPNSIPPGLAELREGRDLHLVANKFDLLPQRLVVCVLIFHPFGYYGYGDETRQALTRPP